jgi:site-specific DNA-methyltransferase (cytosine-N4-specific)
MQAVEHFGGKAPARDVVEAVAEHLEISPAVREQTTTVGDGRVINTFSRRVRWTRQDAVRRGFISGEKYKLWELTEKGRSHLKNIRPGIVITIYETDKGTALWAEAEAAAGVIADNCVNLLISSPPYPLNRQKTYGNLRGQEYLDWLVALASEWKRMLVDDGSMIINLGPVWNKGEPTQSLYQERLLLRLVDDLGLHLAQRFYWSNPGAIPSSEWVTIRRVRVKNTVESIFWLSKSSNPKADNRRVLLPYSDRMHKLIAKGGEYRRLRPSGHGDTKGAFGRDNGGSIPSNLIISANSSASDYYHRQCREHGLPPNPAQWPEPLPEFFIKLCTEPGDIIYDPFFGGGRLGQICERLGRNWIGSDKSLAFLSGSKFNQSSYINRAPNLCAI